MRKEGGVTQGAVGGGRINQEEKKKKRKKGKSEPSGLLEVRAQMIQ